MRNLTVLRKNAIPGSKKTVYVYIEDHENPEVTVEDTPCRKLGELQCCDQKTFSVGEEKAAVYVLDAGIEYLLVGDRTQIPAGKNDLYLTGRVHYGKNAPFRFDGPATTQNPNYKPISERRTLIFAIAITATLLAPLLMHFMPSPGHKNDDTLSSPAATYSQMGVSIELPDNFEKIDADNFTLTYTTKDVALFMLQEPFKDGEDLEFSRWTVKKYAEYVAEKNRIDPEEIQMHGEIPYYTYTANTADGSKFCHYVFTYKTGDSFWMLDFAVQDGDQDLYESAIFQWADTVTFDK